MKTKITTLKKAFEILDKKGYEIGETKGEIPYRIKKDEKEIFMNKREVLFFINYEQAK